MLRQNIAVVYSEASRRAYARAALEAGQVYEFQGAQRKLRWLMGDNAYLAVNGLCSLLRRLGLKYDMLAEGELEPAVLAEYDVVFVAEAGHLPDAAVENLAAWAQGRKKLVVSGRSNLPDRVLGLGSRQPYRTPNWCGLRWQRAALSGRDTVACPPQYTLFLARAQEDASACAAAIEYEGTVAKVLGDGVVVSTNAIYFALPIFEFVGAVLQGHVSLEPARPLLDEPFFFLDRLAYCLREVLRRAGCPWDDIQLRPWGPYEHVLVLRHDTDASMDDTYLQHEREHRIPATYAILPDRRGQRWARLAQGYPWLERAYHYRTNDEGWQRRLLAPGRFVADRQAVAGQGLLKQTLRAERRLGFASETVHRHAPFFYYPETVEALNHLYDSIPRILGSGTMFRFVNRQYWDSPSHRAEYITQHPYTSVPFWFPFQLVVAAVEEHAASRGWESTHLIEPDPSLIDLVFDHARRLPYGVYTLGFHPAHARARTFSQEGVYPWYQYALKRAQEAGWWIANAAAVYRKLNEWEALRLRQHRDGAIIANAGEEEIGGAVLQGPDGAHVAVGLLRPGETRAIRLT